MTKIILATSSQSRQEAFRFLGIDFVAQSSDIDEYFKGRPQSAEELVSHLARLKADAVSKSYKSGIIIGFDSVGWFNEQILEKPKTREETFRRLQSLSGNTLKFCTGIYMKNLGSGKEISKIVVTDIEMRRLEDSEINKYLEQDLQYSTYALGFNPFEYYSSSFVKKINGSYNNLTRGIPLEVIVEMLPEVGYKE